MVATADGNRAVVAEGGARPPADRSVADATNLLLKPWSNLSDGGLMDAPYGSAAIRAFAGVIWP